MIVFPAIDLKDGRGGAALRGRHGSRHGLWREPCRAGAGLRGGRSGAPARGRYRRRLRRREPEPGGRSRRSSRQFPGYVQLGGGIRTAEAVESWFALGVARIVIGTAALKNPEFVKDMAREWENGIVVAVDARDGMVATEGWAEVSDVPVHDMARRFEDAGVSQPAVHRHWPRRASKGRQHRG